MAEARFSRQAERDLEAIAEYTFRNFGEDQARDYGALLAQAARTAANFPSLGKPHTTKQGALYHRYHAGRHALFYRPTVEGVSIVRILHLMMDFDRHL